MVLQVMFLTVCEFAPERDHDRQMGYARQQLQQMDGEQAFPVLGMCWRSDPSEATDG
jgi:hypothetical protein